MEKYSAGGKWYIGYGTECGEEDFPDGVTREEAELLLMSKVERYEEKLNDFFDRYDVSPTQGQFDALICFSYNFGTGWMSGTSALVKIARGEIDATRLEVAQAFGEWCHSGGQAQRCTTCRRRNTSPRGSPLPLRSAQWPYPLRASGDRSPLRFALGALHFLLQRTAHNRSPSAP